MPKSRITEVVEQLKQAVLRKDGAGLPDGRLLEIFVNHNEHAAFEAIVRRHGAMVWGVCRRILGNEHDADDAFQASFLVLLRKAASIRPREMVGNWLYGVAYQTALKAKAVAARRRARETQVKQLPETAVEQRAEWNDLRSLLDRELSCLPAKYRAVLVLCDLGGRSRKEAARQLGCPEGTIAGRLARARVLLARRLKRYGPLLSGGALAALIAEQAASASVPRALMLATIKAAKLLFTGEKAAAGCISITVTGLMKGVMQTMLLNKLKTMATALLMVGVFGAGGTLLTHGTMAGQENGTDVIERSSGRPEPLKKLPKTDLERLQGVWGVVSAKGGVNASFPKEAVFIVDGKRACWQMSDDDFQGGLYLGQAANPKAYDFASHRKTVEGIYSLDGDTLRLCYELGTDSFGSGAKRPTRFAADDRQVLVVLKRLYGPEVLDYRLADGTKAFPPIVERSAKNSEGSRPQPPPLNLDDLRELREQNRLLRDLVKSLANKRHDKEKTAYVASEKKEFKLPAVSLGQPIERLSLLVSSDGGKNWKLAAEKIAPPALSRQEFTYTAPGDGVYWFHIVVVGKDKTVTRIFQETSPLKILVDTAAPVPAP